MSTSDREAWARLRLVQGESSAQVWELISSAGHTTLTVGSNPSCNWVVKERGVAPVHFSIHWDGAILRVADTYGAGDVVVDGAELGAQWRPLSGRVRIDFGKAAIVAEASGPASAGASGASRSEPAHPLEPSAPSPGSSRSNIKATLIGVSPLTPGGVPVAAAQVAPSNAPSSGSDAFRPAHAESARPAKATLVGIAAAPSSAPPGTTGTAPQGAPAAKGNKGIPAGTLMGMGLAEARAQALESYAEPGSATRRVGGASLADGDQRTIQGFPAQPVVQVGSGRPAEAGVSESGTPAAPTPAVVSARGASFGDARDTSAEILESSNTPQAVLVDPAHAARHGSSQAAAPRTPSPYPPPGDRAQRFSDAPTQMRDGAAVNSVRPGKPFPWAYVGIGVLTLVAYFAWLYLLDHL